MSMRNAGSSTREGSSSAPRPAALPIGFVGRLMAVVATGACVVGLATVTHAFRGPGTDATAAAGATTEVPDAPPARARIVRTSFGTLVVHEPRLTRGISARALGGQSHGINDYVPPERQLVQVPVTLRNVSGRPSEYDARRFRLALRAAGSKHDTGTAQLASSTLRSGTLTSGASIDAELTFVVPRTGAEMYLRFHDGPQPHRVSIGDAGPVHRPQVGDHSRHAHRQHTP